MSFPWVLFSKILWFSQLEFLGLYPTNSSNTVLDSTNKIEEPQKDPSKHDCSKDEELLMNLVGVSKEVDDILNSCRTSYKVYSDRQIKTDPEFNPIRQNKSENLSTFENEVTGTAMKHRQNVGRQSLELSRDVNPELVLERTEVCPVHGDVSVWSTVCTHSYNSC